MPDRLKKVRRVVEFMRECQVRSRRRDNRFQAQRGLQLEPEL
jgi:hypothetical protein